MINEPPIDELTSKLGDKYNGSKYAFCVVVAKRARQLIDMSRTNSGILNNQKPLTAAAIEVYDGKITVTNS